MKPAPKPFSHANVERLIAAVKRSPTGYKQELGKTVARERKAKRHRNGPPQPLEGSDYQ